jgi:hypothetical protein
LVVRLQRGGIEAFAGNDVLDQERAGQRGIRREAFALERSQRLDVAGLPVDHERVGHLALERDQRNESDGFEHGDKGCDTGCDPGDLPRAAFRAHAIVGPAVGRCVIVVELFPRHVVHRR